MNSLGFQPVQNTNSISASTIALALLIGTGTSFPVESAETWKPFVQSRDNSILLTINEKSSLDCRMAIEHLENIRAQFEPSVSDLAGYLSVSRQMLYKWMSGESVPSQENEERIQKLNSIADRFKDAHTFRSGVMIKIKAFSGRSLMDIFKAGEDYDEYVDKLIEEARIMEASYKQSQLASSKAKSTNDWKSYISIPSMSEDV